MLDICTFVFLHHSRYQSAASTPPGPGVIPFRRMSSVAGALQIVLFAVAIAFADKAPVAARPFTDAGGRSVEIPDRISRVLTAGPPASVLVYVLAPDKLVGWVREPTAPEKEFLMPAARSLPITGRLTGQGGTVSLEAVLAARPDIIIDVGTVNDIFISLADRVQERTGIPYVLIDGSLEKTPDSLRQAGDLLGVSARAGDLAAYAEETLTTLDDGLAGIPAAQRPKVYYGRGADGLETGLAGSINLEILDAVGATNVAAAAGKGGLTTVSLEQVAGWNPQVILAATPGFARAARNDPLWADLAAVKDGKVYSTPMLPFGWFDSPPGVNRLIGIRWLEALLYPIAFKADLEADVRRFFKLFYQVDLTDVQLGGLLKDAMPPKT